MNCQLYANVCTHQRRHSWTAAVVGLSLMALVASFTAAAGEDAGGGAQNRPYTLTINNASTAQRDAIAATVPASRISTLEDPAALAFWLRQLTKAGAEALEPLGYYNANLTYTIDANTVTVRLEPGEPVRVASVSIRYTDPEVSPGVPFPLKVGQILNHQHYESGKQAIAAWLLNHGYLASQLVTHEVRVEQQRNRAEIELAWAPGPRFRYGAISFTDSELEPGFLNRYLTVKPGEYFSESALQVLSEGLRGSGYFAAVEVIPGALDQASETVPIEIQLTPRKQSAYQAGIIYATDAGPGVEAGVERRWLNSQGWQGRVRLELASRRSLAAARLDIPSPSNLDRSLSLSLNVVDESTDSSDRQTAQLAVSRLSRWGPWSRIDGLTYLVEDFQIGQQDDTVGFLLGSLELTRTQSDNTAVPRSGWRAGAVIQTSAEDLGSDTSLVRLELNGKRIFPLGQQYRLLLRGQLGALWADRFEATPASLRFFAGGDRSIRGFDFEELGPVSDSGDPLGGEYVATSSLELDGPLGGKFRWAAFVDAGNAFGSGIEDVAYSAGIGLRWLTPIGPLRLDVASALTDAESDFKIHFTAGPDL